MPLEKLIKNLRIAILIPCYKRPEYTKKLIEGLNKCEMVGDVTFYIVDDGSNDGTSELFTDLKHSHVVQSNVINQGLRNVIIDFFDWAKGDFDIIGKIDNDQEVPKDFLQGILKVFDESIVDILSPNVYPSNAAFIHGREDEGDYGYRPSKIVGGLWFMKAELIEDIIFERLDTKGFTGAFPLLKQIIAIKDPVVGWAYRVNFEDVGHWTGNHPKHIKDLQHREYYVEVDRKMSW
jgi:glycosyltransferase involved in cell wall biosynthesis